MSFAPPAGYGTTMRTGRDGKFCAAAGNITATINAPIQP
jgi:hypothetical protein